MQAITSVIVFAISLLGLALTTLLFLDILESRKSYKKFKKETEKLFKELDELEKEHTEKLKDE